LSVLSIILGGGKGTRLYPLTKERAKPAVPFAGKYRLVDIPISNSINSGLRQIYVLTQYNSVSLHGHIAQTFVFDAFSGGFVQILAAQQTLDHSEWYGGNADAVRRNLGHFRGHSPDHFLILSGDQLYRMDLSRLVRHHEESGADVTIAAKPVTRQRASSMGILACDPAGRVVDFLEKPGEEDNISHLRAPAGLLEGEKHAPFLASMGIYVFRFGRLRQALDNAMADFGSQVIPACIRSMDVRAWVFSGYWEDVGTIRSFYDVNMNLTSPRPPFEFYDAERPIYTVRRNLPSTRIYSSAIERSLAADGSVIDHATMTDSLIGIRSIIGPGVELDSVYCMGADYYERPEDKAENRRLGVPDIGIGRDVKIRRTILDKNARVGDGARIGVDERTRADGDYEGYSVRAGIIILPKNAVVPPGTVI
jgi:glucose-1-phosphate adenylyltransferase